LTAPTRLEVGIVLRAHGVKGEARVRLHWGGSRSLDKAKHVWLTQAEQAPVRYAIEACRRADKDLLIRFAGVVDRDQAEALRGASVSVERAQLEPLAEGEYLLVDLIGAQVLAPTGPIGRVRAVRTHPTVDTLVISAPDGRELEQPLLPVWVARVNVEAGIIELSSTDGLI
jgi:16S rRNA processing protein RimM